MIGMKLFLELPKTVDVPQQYIEVVQFVAAQDRTGDL